MLYIIMSLFFLVPIAAVIAWMTVNIIIFLNTPIIISM